MSFSKAAWLSLFCLCSMSAQADDVAPDIEVVDNPYSLKNLKKKQGPKEPEIPLHAALVSAVVSRIEECYKLEQKEAMNEADRKLLKASGQEAVRELAPAFRFSSCDIEKPPTERCLTDMTTMDCAILAEPIIAAGYDRNLTPAQKAKVRAYATALAKRESTCNNFDKDEAAIRDEIRVDKLGILIEAQIVMGQCQILPEEQAPCEAELVSMSCDEVLATSNRGEVQKLCPDFLICTDTPKVEDKDPGPND